MNRRVVLIGCCSQAHVHGDARRAEDQQQDGDVDDARRLPRRPQDARGVPQPRAHQVRRRVISLVTVFLCPLLALN
jgi:hypothetical protein